MREGQVIARIQKNWLNDYTEMGCLNATDFKLIHGEEEENLYITGEYYIVRPNIYYGRTAEYCQLVVRKFAHPPIEVTPGFEGEDISYFKSYAEALKKIAEDGSGETDYTIRNLVERDFDTVADDGTVTNDASEALSQITPEHARSLTFESGKRPSESGYRTNHYGYVGDHYEIRLRNQVLNLPENVDVTFQNVVLQYDQGVNCQLKDTETVVIVGNGGRIKMNMEN